MSDLQLLDLGVGDEVFYYDPDHFFRPRIFFVSGILTDDGLLSDPTQLVEISDYDDLDRSFPVPLHELHTDYPGR